MSGIALAIFGQGCESGPQIRQTRMPVTGMEIRRVSSGTMFESVESRPSTRARVEPMTLGTGPTAMERSRRVLREPTKVRVLYRGTYRAYVLLKGGERGYVPVTSLEEYLPATAFESTDGPGGGGRRRRNEPQISVEEMSFDIGMDVIVDQKLIDEVNKAPAPAP